MPGISPIGSLSPVFSHKKGSGASVGPDIYFIMLWGQSNNTSRYEITGNLPVGQQGPQTGIYNWAYNGNSPQFQTYESGVNDSYGTGLVINSATADYNNKPSKFGIGNTLAYKLYNTYGKKCYMVQQAVGGTGLDSSFTPLTWDVNTSANLYQQALTSSITAFAACKAANPGKVIKPVMLWIQGESDAFTSLTTANNYQSNLTGFINKSRVDLAIADSLLANVDWVVTSLRADTVSYPWRDLVQRAQVAVCSTLSNIYLHYMFTNRTTLSPDTEHYNPITASYGGTLSAINAGNDLADAFVKLYNPIVSNNYVQFMGADIATVGDYRYNVSKTHSVLKILDTGGKTLDNYIIVGGGGSGGNGVGTCGGGGGGGQVKVGSSSVISTISYPMYIGFGAAMSPSATFGKGLNGDPSAFFGVTSIGGGYGGGYDIDVNGGNGGNGGGGGDYGAVGTGNAPGTGGTGDLNGGNGFAYPGGAGGGAGGGQAGVNGTALTAGNGGNGLLWVDGSYYGGGGGGSCLATGTPGAGGLGGGGKGQQRSSSSPSVSGTDYLGGGGGGNADTSDPLTVGGIGVVKQRIKFQN